MDTQRAKLLLKLVLTYVLVYLIMEGQQCFISNRILGEMF